MTPENRDKFNYIAGKYNQQVKFYNVDELCKDKIAEIKNFFPKSKEYYATVATFYRFFTVYILDSEIKKIIYLDSDIAVNLDINELWQVEIGDKPLAAVPELYNGVPTNLLPLCKDKLVKPENYFNAGVMLLNLNFLRNENDFLQRGAKFIAENPKYNYLDQDILNYLFSDTFIKLPVKFNTFVRNCRWRGDFSVNQANYHYLGDSLQLNAQDNFNFLWLKYFMKTPFFNEDTIKNLYGGIQQIYIQQKNFSRQVSALISGKTRAFFVQPNNLDAVRQIFYIQPNEEIIFADSPASLQNFISCCCRMNFRRCKKF